MSPKELTDRFEHISGSEMHRKQYHELEQQKLKAEEQTSFLFSKRKGVTQEKKQKKEQKEEAEKHVRMQQELVNNSFCHCQSCLPVLLCLFMTPTFGCDKGVQRFYATVATINVLHRWSSMVPAS